MQISARSHCWQQITWMIILVIVTTWAPRTHAQDVLATREYHQLTLLTNVGGNWSPAIAGDTVYFTRLTDDRTCYQILAVDASGGPPRVVDTWVVAEHGPMLGFSYAHGPVAIGSSNVRNKGRDIVRLEQPVITSLSGPLFSVGFGANIRDSTMRLDTGVYRVTDSGYESILTSRQVADALGVLPVEVGRLEKLSSSLDGRRFACFAIVGSERQEVFSKIGYWFITYDGSTVTAMNESNQPYKAGEMPQFAVSGDGTLVAWGDYNWKRIQITSFGQRGGRDLFAIDDTRGGAELGGEIRFFYQGDKLAVLMAGSGYAALAEGSKPYEAIPPGIPVFGSQGSFQRPYTNETTRGLFAGYIVTPRGLQIGIMRLNPAPDLIRSDAPDIRRYSVNPSFISSDVNRPAILRVAVASLHPVTHAFYGHLRNGLLAREETPNPDLTNNGQAPDEKADDDTWSSRLWVYPQVTGTRTVRTTVLNRDSSESYHGYGIETGPYTIGENPPPARPDLIDVIPPNQRSDATGDLAGRTSDPGVSGGSGDASSGTSGQQRGGTGNTGPGHPGQGGSGDGIPGAGAGNGGGGATAGLGNGADSSGGSGRRGENGSAGGTAGPGGTPPKPVRPTIEVGRRVVQPNATTTVPVYLRYPLGTANLNVEVRYDPRCVAPVGDVIRGNTLGPAALFSANTAESGIVRIGFAGSSAITVDGTIAEITFRAVGRPGESTALTPTVTTMNTASRELIAPATAPGEIAIVARRAPGDGDGDGQLTAADALAALEMSVRLRPVDLSLDMDSDQTVSSLDAALILRAAVGGRQ